jgi:molybdate transport system substrate-binding protein
MPQIVLYSRRYSASSDRGEGSSLMKRLVVALAVATLLPVVLSSCGSRDDKSSSSASGSTLTVFAASSLTGAFTTIGQDFEKSHSGVSVTFDFGGSSDLVSQLQNGAPADVFASADTTNMHKATSAKLTVGTPVDFASNTMEIAVPPGNPAQITTFADLTKPGVKLVACAPEVPCGAAAAQLAHVAHQTLKPVSEEQSVTDVLAKVESGEADAGLVYVTDVQAAGNKVEGITFEESSQVVNTYPIVAIDRGNTDLAKSFIDEVLGPDGQQVLADFGFAKP